MKKSVAAFFIGIAAVLVCCAFTICPKLSKETDGGYRIYVYPICGDSTTFITQEFEKLDTETVRVLPNGKWTAFTDNYRIDEAFVVAGVELHTMEIRRLERRTSITYRSNWGTANQLTNSTGTLPDIRLFKVNDFLSVTVAYFGNGQIKSCNVNVGSNASLRETIEFDSISQSCWVGVQKISGFNRDSTVREYEQTGEVITLFRISDIYQRTGKWLRYNFQGIVTDSIFYK